MGLPPVPSIASVAGSFSIAVMGLPMSFAIFPEHVQLHETVRGHADGEMRPLAYLFGDGGSDVQRNSISYGMRDADLLSCRSRIEERREEASE